METKVIVITGASSGIGAALAKRLGQEGHRLVLVARNESDLKSIAIESNTSALPIVADLTKREEVIRLRDSALEKFGNIDVWINNAGRGINKRVMSLTDEDIDQMIDINLKAALYGMQAIIPNFQKQGHGHLINISTFLARLPLASNRSAYNAAKSGLNALTANLRMDLRSDYPNIHISLVMPGVVSTDFDQHALGSTSESLARFRSMPSQTPQEVASIIASLIEHPVAEIYTNPSSAEMAQRYFADVGAFEDNMSKRPISPPK